MNFFIKSYGCQANVYDSTRMSDILATSGYESSEEIEKSDIIIFNTCSIREKADEKLFSDLGRVKFFKPIDKNLDDRIIIVCGCVAQTQHEDIIKRAPYVDAILGPQEIYKIVDVIKEIIEKRKRKNKSSKCSIIKCNFDTENKFKNLNKAKIIDRSYSEFLTIQEGCDNFCTYCVVPYTRGREFSRNASDIIEEAKKLISVGVKEITLLGQNVNSYHGEGIDGKIWSFSRLLYEIAELESLGLVRLRYVTSNPKDIAEDIGKAHRDIKILAPFLHLPVQSGSHEILRKMNRKYSVSKYLSCIDMLRKYRSDIAFSSDFIVGFPGESDKDFEDTVKLAETVRFAQAYSFKYSSRKGTVAARMDNQIPEKIKSERLQILQKILNEHQKEFNENTVGKTVSVLLTKKGRYKNQLGGRSEYSQAVSVSCDSTVNIGDMLNVKITGVKSHSLVGILEK